MIIRRRILFPFSIMLCLVTGCSLSPGMPVTTQAPTIPPDMPIPTTAIPTFTPLPGPCATPAPDILKDFINNSITIEDSGKTFVTHVTSRFWIYLDDRIYPLRDLLDAIPDGLVGYISNGSIRGPQCYPIMFEAVREGKGSLMIKDFRL